MKFHYRMLRQVLTMIETKSKNWTKQNMQFYCIQFYECFHLSFFVGIKKTQTHTHTQLQLQLQLLHYTVKYSDTTYHLSELIRYSTVPFQRTATAISDIEGASIQVQKLSTSSTSSLSSLQYSSSYVSSYCCCWPQSSRPLLSPQYYLQLNQNQLILYRIVPKDQYIDYNSLDKIDRSSFWFLNFSCADGGYFICHCMLNVKSIPFDYLYVY